MDTYDVVVVGGGSTGEVAAGRLAAGGLSVLVVESERVGGECSYFACMPSKTLLRPGSGRAIARAIPGLSGRAALGIDAKEAFANRDQITHRLDDQSQVAWLRDAKVDLLRGRARLTGPKRLAVRARDGKVHEVQARRAVLLATGSHAQIPDLPGLRASKPWTSREATQAHAVPPSLAVLGAGPVGTELAQAFHALGAREVTLLERGPRILSKLEPGASARVQAALEAEGIHVRTGVEARSVQRGSTGEVRIELSRGGAVVAAELLVALGRTPGTADLGLETVGLEPGKYLEVDDALRVKAVPEGWLFACGDCNGRNLLTHMGKYQARIAADVILGRDAQAFADHRATPQVVFTHPEVAAVGLTEAEAQTRGLSVRTAEYALEDVAGVRVSGEGLTGWAKVVVDTPRNVLVGVTFVGPEVGELLHAATIAVAANVPLEQLWHAVPAYPTVSEVWLRLLEKLGL